MRDCGGGLSWIPVTVGLFPELLLALRFGPLHCARTAASYDLVRQPVRSHIFMPKTGFEEGFAHGRRGGLKRSAGRLWAG